MLDILLCIGPGVDELCEASMFIGCGLSILVAACPPPADFVWVWINGLNDDVTDIDGDPMLRALLRAFCNPADGFWSFVDFFFLTPPSKTWSLGCLGDKGQQICENLSKDDIRRILKIGQDVLDATSIKVLRTREAHAERVGDILVRHGGIIALALKDMSHPLILPFCSSDHFRGYVWRFCEFGGLWFEGMS